MSDETPTPVEPAQDNFEYLSEVSKRYDVIDDTPPAAQAHLNAEAAQPKAELPPDFAE